MEQSGNDSLLFLFNGSSLNHLLKTKRKEEAFALLKQKKINVNEKDEYNLAPLHYCSISDYSEIANLLIQQGADPDIQGGDYKQTPLHFAAIHGSLRVAILLLSKSIDKFIQNSQGLSAIHLAAQYNHPLLLHIFVQEGISVNDLDGQSRTALHWGAIQGNISIVRYLTQQNCNLNLQDNDGCTALHWAALMSHSEITILLIKAFADVSIRDNFDQTVFDILIENRNFQILRRIELTQKSQFLARKKIFGYFSKHYFYMIMPSLLAGIFFVLISNFSLLACLLISPILFAPYMIQAREVELIFVKNPTALGMAAGFLLMIYGTYFWKIYPIFSIFFLTTSAIMFWAYYQSIVKNPGFLDEQKVTKESLTNKNTWMGKYPSDIIEDKFCETCQIIRPLRSKHDAKSGKCVARFDHFCPWTINPVGYKNHAIFYLFLVTVFISEFIYVIFTFLTLLQNPQIRPFHFFSFYNFFIDFFIYETWMFCIICMDIFFCGWNFLLFRQHSVLIAKNQTANEIINSKRYSHFWVGDVHFNPFNTGTYYSNALQFFQIKYVVDWMKTYFFEEVNFGSCEHLKLFPEQKKIL
ncbi:palmitoyltransferase hip14 [Anaeramoeba ignava]|uniref:Palmitoyltransferase n=1 Tax=Anaeramoeba ignava TaxID=1746090 RepID=A0A9Q0RF47_ANAIG|nr:palmitoyltransferase hip14 [Anaeramoeba ignava]